jgi:hypothetical protein
MIVVALREKWERTMADLRAGGNEPPATDLRALELALSRMEKMAEVLTW